MDKIPQETPVAQTHLENEPVHKSFLNQKGSFLLILGVVVIILVILGGYLLTMNKNSNSNQNISQRTSNEVAKKLFNYKLVYTKDQKIYMYDLATDTSKEVNTEYATLQNVAAGWSKNGIFAFENQDTKSLFLIEPPYQNSRKLLTDFVGGSFWKSDGSGIYFAKSFNNGKQVPYVEGIGMQPDKTYFIAIDGTQKEVTMEEFKNEDYLGPTITTENPASFDNTYMAKSTFSDNKDAQVTLIADKTYPLPDGSYRPLISPDNTYLGYKENKNFTNSSPLKVFSLKDVLIGKFDNPVITNDDAGYEWEWVDNEDILYAAYKVASTNDNLAYTYSFNLLNVKTKKVTTLIPPFTTDQAYMTIHVSPNGKHFVYNLVHQSGKTADTYSAQNEFIVADSKTGKEIRRFSTDPFTSSWSTPIVSK